MSDAGVNDVKLAVGLSFDILCIFDSTQVSGTLSVKKTPMVCSCSTTSWQTLMLTKTE